MSKILQFPFKNAALERGAIYPLQKQYIKTSKAIIDFVKFGIYNMESVRQLATFQFHKYPSSTIINPNINVRAKDCKVKDTYGAQTE